MRIVFGKDARLLPLHLHPRRVADNEIKAAALLEHGREFQFPVQEVVALGDLLGGLREREEPVEIRERGIAPEFLFQRDALDRLAEIDPEIKLQLLLVVKVAFREDAHDGLEVLPRRQFFGLVERPEPERTPEIEDRLEAEIIGNGTERLGVVDVAVLVTGKFRVELTVLRLDVLVSARLRLVPEVGHVVSRPVVQRLDVVRRAAPDAVDCL